jgi:uncharacterized membrane protein
MTEFFLLDKDGLLEAYPVTLRAIDPVSINYGIVNREREAATYRVRAQLDGATIASTSPVRLEPGQAQQAQIELTLPEELARESTNARKVTFILYRQDEPYRSLHLWFEIEPGKKTANLNRSILTPVE